MIKKLIFVLFALNTFFLNAGLAQEVNSLARSPRALLMGDAYTAIADDEFTLFYNPAALGGNKGVSLTLLDPTLGMTDILGDLGRFKNLPKGPGAAPLIANRILDLPVYIQAGIFPTLKMGGFGFTLFANSKASLVLRNATNPIFDVNYRYDRGFIFGYAYNIGNGGLSSKGKKGSKITTNPGTRLSIGIAAKHMNREGLQNQFDLFGTTLLNKINSGATDIASLKNALGYSKGSAWGYDLGSEYVISSGHSTFTSALSILDIGATRFNKTQGIADVPKQDMMINSGVAYKQDFGLFDYTLSADIHPMNSAIDFGRKFHFGSELSLPLITFNVGWSEGYVSYGGSIKLWPVKITTGFYGVEVGSHFREQEAKRFILYVSLFDFSIDL
ncbi:MAG: hypothetical protein H7281_03380 [Bacteriovorax sp.]|nr:hypothetical protein [Bacteriovorax sp.]